MGSYLAPCAASSFSSRCMTEVRYAAYGSNLHPQRLSRRVASAQLLGTAFLPDWSLLFHKRSVDASGKCSIQRGSIGVHFAVYDISRADKRILDAIEGVGSGYELIKLELPEYGESFSYTASNSHIDDGLQPYDWYRALVLAGARTLDFPVDYVAGIAATRARRDPDAGRHQAMWDLVNSIEVQGLHLPGKRVSTPAE